MLSLPSGGPHGNNFLLILLWLFFILLIISYNIGIGIEIKSKKRNRQHTGNTVVSFLFFIITSILHYYFHHYMTAFILHDRFHSTSSPALSPICPGDTHFQSFFFPLPLPPDASSAFLEVTFFAALRESPVSSSNFFRSSLASWDNLSGTCTTSVT